MQILYTSLLMRMLIDKVYFLTFHRRPSLCNLKTMLDVFYGWRLQTLIQLYGWTTCGMVFQGCRESCFLVCFCFWFVLLFCMLMQKDLGELVSVMECDHGCSMEIFYELCESWLCERIGEEISGERRDKERRNIYDVGWREGGRFFCWRNG